MILPRQVLQEGKKTFRFHINLHDAVLAVILIYSNLCAGSRNYSDFGSPSSSNNVDFGDTISLSVNEWRMIKVLDETYPGENSSDSSYSPDIVSSGSDSFIVFWAVHDSVYDSISMRSFVLEDTGAVAKPMMTVADHFDSLRTPVTYLHASSGSDDFLVTSVDNSNSTGLLDGFSSGASQRFVEDDFKVPYSSSCHLADNTYIIAHTFDFGEIVLIKASSDGSTITELLRDTIPGSVYFTNVSVASDTKGQVCVVYPQGMKNQNRDIEFSIYDGSDFSKIDSGEIAAAVDQNLEFNFYDDTPVVSYAPDKFASVHWDVNGILLDTVTLDGGNASAGSVRIISQSGCRSPVIAASEEHLVVAWKGNVKNNVTPGIEGIKYDIVNGNVLLGSADTLMFSDASIDADFSSRQLNCAVDSSGNIGVTWTQNGSVTAVIWARRGVLETEGEWISDVDSVYVPSGDSLQYVLSSTTISGGGDSITDSIRIGPVPAVDGSWTGWISLGSAGDLSAQTKGHNRYFQWKSNLYRENDNITLGPVVTGSDIKWNFKPRYISLDSLKVNGAQRSTSGFGDTVNVYSRFDTTLCFLTLRDADTGDTVFSSAIWPTLDKDTVSDLFNHSVEHRLEPVSVSDSVYLCEFTAVDTNGWNADTGSFYVRTVNSVPDPGLTAAVDTNSDGTADSLIIGLLPVIINIERDDSIMISYSVYDTNDPGIYAFISKNSSKLDSSIQGEKKEYKIHGTDIGAATDTVKLEAEDDDTVVSLFFYARANITPVIDSVKMRGETVPEDDTVTIVPGIAHSIEIFVSDSNIMYWDDLYYRFMTKSFDTLQNDSSFSFIPSLDDSDMTVIVTDLSGMSDTLQYVFKYPWYNTDSLSNPDYVKAKHTLYDSVSFIIGASRSMDTVDIPVLNTGNDTLVISGAGFNGSTGGGWLSLGLTQGASYQYFESLSITDDISQIKIPQDSTNTVKAVLDCGTLSGDGIVRDTIILGTNDPAHPYDTIPVRLEYNDLPTISSISFEYTKGEPYWLAKSAASDYVFPPHAKVGIEFSEPMDSASADGKITAYSILDSMITDSITPINLYHSWNNTYTLLSLSPVYSAPSGYFGGIYPDSGFFIPTDSIAFVVSSDLVDQAATPSGPNSLDVNLDFERDTSSDTVVALRVDSTHFVIDSVTPSEGQAVINAGDSVVLYFSSPVYPGTVDTSSENNRSLIITSYYLSNSDSSRQAGFDSVKIEDNRAVFFVKKGFFFGDSVVCYYRGITGRDSLGYPLDSDGDGLPAALFDSASAADDYSWQFIVPDVLRAGLSPDSGETGVSIDVPVVITFSDSVYPGIIDTSLTENRSLFVSSRFSGGSRIDFDSISVNGPRAFFYLSQRLYYRDSVHCRFNGLVNSDTSAFAVDPGDTGYITTDDTVSWFFIVEEFFLEEVSPESASVKAGAGSPIKLTFSGPVTAAMIDTTTEADSNASFQITSRYSEGKRLPIKRIYFSSDSIEATIDMKRKYFSHDSIFCVFNGISSTYSYDSETNVLPGSSGGFYGNYSWYFKTGSVGFYTFPNPYKPGSSRKHRQMGGIMFKNLHSLQKGVVDVVVSVYDINTHEVYNSKKAGEEIRFREHESDEEPQWLWNTKNNKGNKLASGIYFYAIKSKKGELLVKGKIVIVR